MVHRSWHYRMLQLQEIEEAARYIFASLCSMCMIIVARRYLFHPASSHKVAKLGKYTIVVLFRAVFWFWNYRFCFTEAFCREQRTVTQSLYLRIALHILLGKTPRCLMRVTGRQKVHMLHRQMFPGWWSCSSEREVRFGHYNYIVSVICIKRKRPEDVEVYKDKNTTYKDQF